MASSKYGKHEKIAAVLEHTAGTPVTDICRKYAISQRTFFRWKARWDQANAPDTDTWQALVEENRRLKNLLISTISPGASNHCGDKK